MKIKQFLAIILIAPLPIFLTSRTAGAFNLVYTQPPLSFSYEPVANYKTTVGNDGILTRDFLTKIPPPNIKSDFWRVLTFSFSSGWDFRRNGTPVYGDFLIDKYRVCPPGSTCAALAGSVGAQLNLAYKPNFTFAPDIRQPDPNTGRVRWIQWVRSNHSLATNTHGDKESVIDVDIDRPGNGTPYYYANSDLGNADPIYEFKDAPNRGDIGWSHDWIADLYLTEEITTPGSNVRKVLIYGGVRWGWHNRVNQKKKEPNPNPVGCPANSSSSDSECPPPPPPCNGGSGGGGCNRTAATDYSDYQEPSAFDTNDANEFQYQELSFFNINGTSWTEVQKLPPSGEYENSKSPVSVPESTSALGLLALAAWGVVKALKLRKDG